MKIFDSIEQPVKSELVKNKNIHNLELYTIRYWDKAANEYQEIDPSFINHVNHLLKDYLHKSPFIFLLFNKLFMSNYKIMFERKLDLYDLMYKAFDIPKIKYIPDKRYDLYAASMYFDRNVKCFLNVFDPIEFYKTFVELCNSKFKDLQPIIAYCRWLYGLGIICHIIDRKLLKFLFFKGFTDILRSSYTYKTGMLLYNNFYKKYYSYLSRQKSEEEKKHFKYFQQLIIFLCMSSIQLVLSSLDKFCKLLELKNNRDKKHEIACKAVDIVEHFLYKFLKYKSFLIQPFDAILHNKPPNDPNCYGPLRLPSLASSYFTSSVSAVFTIRCSIFDCQLNKGYHHSYCEKLYRIHQKSYQMRRKVFDELCGKKLKLVAGNENEKPKQ